MRRFTRQSAFMLFVACLAARSDCRAHQGPLNVSRTESVSSDTTRPPLPGGTAATCVPASALPIPPRKLQDRKADLSDLRDVQTHAGVLVFAVRIAAAGNVADVRLIKDVDTRHPWPTVASRWRAAIFDWRYEPQTLNNQAVDVCMTVSVRIEVR